ncbi:MAG: hypothetical protein ACOC32_01080 [Nanoarchaeota archaeon]
MNKKGYFFVIDAFIALMILTVGVYMILSSYLNQLEKDQPAFTSRTVVGFMSNLSIGRFNSDYKFDTIMNYGLGQENVNFIKNYKLSILEQIGEFYYREQLSSYPRDRDGIPYGVSFSEGLAADVIDTLVPPQYEAEFRLYDQQNDEIVTIYRRNENPLFARESSSLLVPAKMIIMGDFQDTETGSPILWGPYIVEVHIWQ